MENFRHPKADGEFWGGEVMNSLSIQTQQTMSSIEIVKIINDMREEGAAELRHDNFMAKVITVLGSEVALKFQGYYKASNGKQNPCYYLPRREATLMVMSENYKVQAAVYDRVTELEQQATQPKPLSPAEMFLAQAQLSVELEKRIGANEAKVEQVEVKVEQTASRLDQISVDLRNGVPHGFISRKNAKSLYAKGLSKIVFEDAMATLNVPTQSYISYGDGYATPTFAYQESHIPTAIAHFIRDLEQVTKCKCFSRILNRRVDYEKIPNYGLKGGATTTGEAAHA